MRRLLLVLVVLAAILVPISRPAPVAAVGQTLEWEDGPGFATFGANAAVTIALGTINFDCDFIVPTANIYVIQGVVSDGAALTDVSGSPNTVTGATGGVFTDTIAFTQPSGTLGEGVYSVVYDECQDGSFDEGIDALFENAFEVVLPSTLPPIDPAIGAIKAQAGTQADRMQTLMNLLELYETYQEIQEAIECITSPAECVVSMIVDEITGAILDQIKIILGLTVDPKLAARDAALDTISHWEGIEADPPDPAFNQHTLIERPAAIDPESGDPLVVAEVALGNAHLTEGALAEALLHAIERYQGAQLADDGDWTLVHAREVRNFAMLMDNQLIDSNTAIFNLVNALDADTRDIDQVSASLSGDRQRIVATGFLPDEERVLLNLGMTQADVDNLRARIADGGTGSVSEFQLVTALNDLAVASANARSTMQSLAGAMDAVIDAILLDPATDDGFPVADAGGPYLANEGASLSLDGSGSGPIVGSIVAHAWDLDGDGAFDDASGATPTVSFSEPLDGFIGLRVTDDRGFTGVSYAAVTITPTNSPPVITAVSPTAFHPEIIIGESETFTVSATDPDGDSISIAWLLDGVNAGSGTSFTYTPLEADGIGGHWLQAAVSAGGDTRVYDWTPLVLLPDADADGWHANADCADTDAAVNPDQTEILGNGKDDDCNPSTTDNFPDADGDGFDASLDCNDADPQVNPGQTEILNNLKDDDCDPATTDNGGPPPIDGYTLIESIIVPIHGQTKLSAQPLQADITYRLRAFGTFVIGGPGFADAEYSFNTTHSFVIDACNNGPFDNIGIHLNGLEDATGKLPKWGPFRADHIYTIDFQGNDAPLSMRYVDCTLDPGGSHGDNSGSLTLEIWAPGSATQPLQVDAGTGQAITEGGSVSVSATITNGDPSSTMSATIDWGDGTVEAGTVSSSGGSVIAGGSHPYHDDGLYTAEVCVISGAASACDTLTVTVSNAPPVVTAGVVPDQTAGAAFSADVATFTDAGSLDTHSATIDWGDGTTEPGTLTQGTGSGSVSGDHTYTSGGSYTVTITVTDDDGGSDATTLTIDVADANSAPVLNALGDLSLDEGTTLTITITALDPDGDAVTVTATGLPSFATFVDDGLGSTTLTLSPNVSDAGTYPNVTITASDGTLSASQTFTISANNINQPPVVDAGPDIAIHAGQPVNSSGSFTDPTSSAWSATIDYGDGSGPQPLPLNVDGTFALSHTYPTSGSFTITVCVTDDDGVTGCDTASASAERYAIFAGRDDCGYGNTKALEWSGSSNTAGGDVHSNSGLKISGSRNRVDGATTYRCDKHISGSRLTFTEGMTKISAVQPWPVLLTIDDFDCDVFVSGTLDLSKDGQWWVGGKKSSRKLKPMTLCADEIRLSGSSISGTVTLVAGEIKISGSSLNLTAHQHGVVAFATDDGHAIKISGSSTRLTGDLVAPNGEIDLSGSCNTVTGTIAGWTVKLSGSSWRIGVQ